MVTEAPTGEDVLTAAHRRIADALDSADSYVVMFSGGKDSQTILHLVRDWATERGRLPVPVVFLDEELLPDGVLRMVEHYAREDWIAMHWFVVPMKNANASMNESKSITTWDVGRHPFRDRPDNEWVITPEPGDASVRSQQSMDGYVYQRLGMEGSAVFVNGIRADESLNRRQSIKQKRTRPHMAKGSDARVSLARPIYDWSTADVFLYLRHQLGVDVCEEYERQALAGMRMRISTPLHGEAIRELHKGVATDPRFLERLYESFADVELHTRYADQLERLSMSSFALCTMKDCAIKIKSLTDPGKREQALRLFKRYIVHHRKSPLAYPAALLMYNIVKGTTQRSMIQPLGTEEQKRLARQAREMNETSD